MLVGDEGPDIILDVAVKLIELDLVVLVTPFLVGLAIFEPLDHVVEEHTMAAAEIGILPGDFLFGTRKEGRHRGR